MMTQNFWWNRERTEDVYLADHTSAYVAWRLKDVTVWVAANSTQLCDSRKTLAEKNRQDDGPCVMYATTETYVCVYVCVFGLQRQDSLLPPYMCSGCSRKQRVTMWSCSVTKLLRINYALQQGWITKCFNLQPYNEETINITTNHINNNKLYIYNYDDNYDLTYL